MANFNSITHACSNVEVLSCVDLRYVEVEECDEVGAGTRRNEKIDVLRGAAYG